MSYKVMEMKQFAEELNNMTFTDYFYRLMLLSKSVFEWKNLPNGIDEKWIEKYLFSEGKCVFYKDKTKGFMVMKCNPYGEYNYYDEPTQLAPFGTNYGKNEILQNYENAVLIRNNDEMIPTSPTIQLYAWRLSELSRTIDLNVNALKTPLIIKCSDKQKLTLQNVYKQWDGFNPVIFGDKALELDKFNVLKTDAPIVFDKLQLQKHAVWNEAMTFIGLNNANQDKKERLVDDEVQANNEQIRMSAEVMLKSRQLACKQINEMFELHISVEMRKPENENIEEIEGVQNPPERSKGCERIRRGA